MLEPLFEFSGACEGCGETPYLKLLTQLLGDRMIVANATGCSSIYGGNLPTTPWTANRDGRGPAWSNSLFEDNAEFGLGMRLALDAQEKQARALAAELAPDLAEALAAADGHTEAGIVEQRRLVAELRERLAAADGPEARRLETLADTLVRKSVWIVGGDGWAYDIGFGGLDHVLASGRNVNVLVLDTEVYSNTGGQASKATPRGAVAKFAAGGKQTGKKDLGLLATSYGNVYVAHIALGADNPQTVKALAEADAWDGPSLVIAYSHCIAHGIDMVKGMRQQKLAVDTGYWPLWRYDPGNAGPGEHPFQLDSRRAKLPLTEFTANEARFSMLRRSRPEEAERLGALAQHDVDERRLVYEQLAEIEHEPDDARDEEEREPRPAHHVPRAPAREPAGRIRVTADRQPRLASRAGGSRGLGGRAAVAVRGADRARRDDAVDLVLERGAQSFGEALTYFPEMDDYNTGPESYVEHVAAAKEALSIPVIASINGVTPGGWVRYAELLQQAGADAIELNVYAVETDPYASAASVEDRTLRLVSKVHGALTVPLAVKVGPYYTALREHGDTARRVRRRRPRPLQPVPAARSRPRDDDGEAGAAPVGQRRDAAAAALDRDSPRPRPGQPRRDERRPDERRRDQAAARRRRRRDARLGAPAGRPRAPGRADAGALGLADGARIRLRRAAEGEHEPGVVRRSARLRALALRPRDRRLPGAWSRNEVVPRPR